MDHREFLIQWVWDGTENLHFCSSLSENHMLRTFVIKPPEIVEKKKEMATFALKFEDFLLLIFISSMSGFYLLFQLLTLTVSSKSFFSTSI